MAFNPAAAAQRAQCVHSPFMRDDGNFIVDYEPSPGIPALFAPPKGPCAHRRPVVFSFRHVGLGANMLALANAYIYAYVINRAANNVSIVIHSGRAQAARRQTGQTILWKNNDTAKCQLQTAWEQVSSFPSFDDGTVVAVPATPCDVKFRAFFPNDGFVNLQRTNSGFFVQLRRYALHRLLRLKPAWHSAMLGMLPPRPQEPTWSVHIRRADKLYAESKRVFAAEYIRAARTSGVRPTVVYLLSDDVAVTNEFTSNWTTATAADWSLPRLVSVAATERPDRTRHNVREVYLKVVADLRAMVQADVFVGTQTSNLGVVACILREHRHCYNAEGKGHYAWDPAKDKIY